MGTFRFGPVRGVSRKDFVVYCIPGDGAFGPPDDLNRRCGAARVPY
jgi:hypothetical protein